MQKTLGLGRSVMHWTQQMDGVFWGGLKLIALNVYPLSRHQTIPVESSHGFKARVKVVF